MQTRGALYLCDNDFKKNFNAKKRYCRILEVFPCQESKRTFGFLCLEGAVGAIWTNPASQGSKMVRVFDFWRQNGAKIDPKGNDAKIAFFSNFSIFSKNLFNFKPKLAPFNWRHF